MVKSIFTYDNYKIVKLRQKYRLEGWVTCNFPERACIYWGTSRDQKIKNSVVGPGVTMLDECISGGGVVINKTLEGDSKKLEYAILNTIRKKPIYMWPQK